MRQQWFPILCAAAVFSTLSIWAAAVSPGFLEADSCTHYQYARFALAEPHYLVNVWGRPFVTGLYAIPATLAGRAGVRGTSLVVALLIAWITFRIAKDQKYRLPALAFVFVLVQPLMFLHSFSELTELPFSLLLALAFWCYRRREWFVMTLLVALLPTARPEGFGFLLLAALALVLHRRWWWIIILPLPLLIWTYAGWRLYGRPQYFDPLAMKLPPTWHWMIWLRHEWPYAQMSAYASGSLLHFVALLPAVVGPIVMPFVAVGVWRSLWGSDEATNRRSDGGNDEGSAIDVSFPSSLRRSVAPSLSLLRTHHLIRCQLLVAIIPLLILAAHSLLYFLGRMASNGELRYMLIVAPFWALLAAKGWEWTFDRLNWRHPFALAAVAALLPLLINLREHVVPQRLTTDSLRARAVAQWYRGTHTSIDYPRIMASNPEVTYFMDVSLTDGGWVREWRKEFVDKPRPGTILVWDSTYALFNADQNRVIPLEEVERAGWTPLPEVSDEINAIGDGGEWQVFVSPQSIFGKPPSAQP